VLLYVLGGNVCYVCFRWQCVLLGVIGGNVWCCMFSVAICVVGCFRCQIELFYVLPG